MTKEFQWKVVQIAKKKFPITMLLGGLSVNLNHLETMAYVKEVNTRSQKKKDKAEKGNKVTKEAVDKYRVAERKESYLLDLCWLHDQI